MYGMNIMIAVVYVTPVILNYWNFIINAYTERT
jgi:hypothetical protein